MSFEFQVMMSSKPLSLKASALTSMDLLSLTKKKKKSCHFVSALTGVVYCESIWFYCRKMISLCFLASVNRICLIFVMFTLCKYRLFRQTYICKVSRHCWSFGFCNYLFYRIWHSVDLVTIHFSLQIWLIDGQSQRCYPFNWLHQLNYYLRAFSEPVLHFPESAKLQVIC